MISEFSQADLSSLLFFAIQGNEKKCCDIYQECAVYDIPEPKDSTTDDLLLEVANEIVFHSEVRIDFEFRHFPTTASHFLRSSQLSPRLVFDGHSDAENLRKVRGVTLSKWFIALLRVSPQLLQANNFISAILQRSIERATVIVVV